MSDALKAIERGTSWAMEGCEVWQAAWNQARFSSSCERCALLRQKLRLACSRKST
ncbi:hypothetical protein IG631_15632 [Alternaria alternata]|jgi:hypothetical protein|nr:hypothetical protein IG631_15632 [Alternaria alternata]